jgi:hypothetical protein
VSPLRHITERFQLISDELNQSMPTVFVFIELSGYGEGLYAIIEETTTAAQLSCQAID